MSAVLMGLADLAGAYYLIGMQGDLPALLGFTLLAKGLMSIFAPR
jgi:hypothetical protein